LASAKPPPQAGQPPTDFEITLLKVLKEANKVEGNVLKYPSDMLKYCPQSYRNVAGWQKQGVPIIIFVNVTEHGQRQKDSNKTSQQLIEKLGDTSPSHVD
jgi:hypothetical protein